MAQQAPRKPRLTSAFTCLALLMSVATGFGAPVSTIHRDEVIQFFPGILSRPAVGPSWDLEVKGIVYEPEKRRVTLAILRQMLGLNDVKLTKAEEITFAERARLFLVDNQGGRKIVIRIGEKVAELGTSRADGHFSGVIHLTDSEAKWLETHQWTFQALLPEGDPRLFSGQACLMKNQGLTVISDIDDTIKVSGMQDRSAMLRRTFIAPFEAVPGMAGLYQGWARQAEAQFCYVSASPWQLLDPLMAFVRSNGFPSGVFYLKKFRVKDGSFLGLFKNPEKYKLSVLEPLLLRFPDRRFVFVGDSGERDPEVYGQLARKYRGQVVWVFIRNMGESDADAARFQEAFRDLPPKLWKVFRDPAELGREAIFPGPPAGMTMEPKTGSTRSGDGRL